MGREKSAPSSSRDREKLLDGGEVGMQEGLPVHLAAVDRARPTGYIGLASVTPMNPKIVRR